MFSKGDMVVYGQTGVCCVEKVGRSKIIKSDEIYYTLKPMYASGRVYVPASTNIYLRKIISGNEAKMWIDKIPQIPEYICSDRKLAVQKNFYQKAVQSHDFEVLIGIVKGLYQKRHRLQNIKNLLRQ